MKCDITGIHVHCFVFLFILKLTIVLLHSVAEPVCFLPAPVFLAGNEDVAHRCQNFAHNYS